MTRFSDGTRVVIIDMYMFDGVEQYPSIDKDYFSAPDLDYDKQNYAFVSDDLDYLVKQAYLWQSYDDDSTFYDNREEQIREEKHFGLRRCVEVHQYLILKGK